jgi:hypothetical protein
LLDANPLTQIENLHRIAGVVRAGNHFSSADLNHLKLRVANSGGILH